MKRILIAALACSCLMTGSAYAATVDSVVVSDFENSVITVSGTIDENEKSVSVVVIKKGELLDVGEKSGSEFSIQNAVIDGDKYNTSFKFEAEEGFYEVYASNSQASYEFEYISKSSVIKFVEDLGNKNINKDEIYSMLERYAASLGADLKFISNNSEKEYLTDNLIYYSERISQNGIDGVRDIIKLTQAELEFMNKLKATAVASAVNTLIKDYSAKTDINVTSYNNLSDTNKMKVCTQFVGASYTDIDVFKTDFEKAVKSSTGNTNYISPGGGGGTGGGGGSNNVSSAVISQPSTITIRDNKVDSAPVNISDIYTDVSDAEWAWSAIIYMSENGIMEGFGNKIFAPHKELTREQFAKIITIAFDLYDENNTFNFKDVNGQHWAAAYIASAAKAGIMTGIEEGVFGLGMPITREDMCTTIYRAAIKSGMSYEAANKNFSDFNDVSDYAKEAVSKLAGSGVISGTENGKFEPKLSATRAQIAKIVYLVLDM